MLPHSEHLRTRDRPYFLECGRITYGLHSLCFSLSCFGMALDTLNLSTIAIAAMAIKPIARTINAMATVQSNLSANQSNPSPIELADRAQRKIFIVSVIFGVVAAVIAALLASLVFRTNNVYQAAVKADADARILVARAEAETAKKDAAEANKGVAKANLEIENAKKATAEANAVAKTAEEGAAKANERAEKLEQQNITLRTDLNKAGAEANVEKQKVARMQIEVAEARTKQAEAERQLLQLQERTTPRQLSGRQQRFLSNELKKYRGTPVAFTRIADAEANAFGGRMLAALMMSGWTVQSSNNAGTPSPPVYGVRIVFPSKSNPMGTPASQALISALQQLDVEMKISPNPDESELITIFVGLKPVKP